MPTESLREQFLSKLKTTLEGITTSAGYFHTVQWVERASSNPLDRDITPALAIIVSGEQKSASGVSGSITPFRHVAAVLSLEIEFKFLAPIAEMDTQGNRLMADIEKAVMTLDAGLGGPKIGGAVFHIESVGNEMNLPELLDNYGRGVVFFRVSYVHKDGDPSAA
jgi:hypothetical protein